MMKQFLYLLLVPALLTGAAAKTYTLEELVNTGYQNSPEIKKVEQEILKTKSQVTEAYGSALPSIDFAVNYQYAFAQYNPMTDAFDMSSLDMTGGDTTTLTGTLDDWGFPQIYQPGISQQDSAIRSIAYAFDGMTEGLSGMMEGMSGLEDLNKDQTLTYGITASGPLFAQGKVGIGLKIAKVYLEGLESKMKAARMEVTGQVTKLFYTVLLTQRNTLIQEESVRLAEESLRLTELRQSVGKGTELEVMAARLNLEKARLDLTTGQGQLRMVKEALIKQTGISESGATLEITGEFPEPEYSVDLDEAVSMVRKNNQQIRQLESGAAVQDQLVKLAKSDFYPMVYYQANLGQITQFNAGDDIEWSNTGSIAAGMSINLFQGGQTVQKIKQAKNDRAVFMETMRQASDGLELAVRSAYEALETSRSQLASVNAIEELAEKGYAVSSKAFEMGLATQLEQEKSELDLKGARIAKNAALFAFTSAVIDMKILTNTLEIQ